MADMAGGSEAPRGGVSERDDEFRLGHYESRSWKQSLSS
jgi:hypothetical protein